MENEKKVVAQALKGDMNSLHLIVEEMQGIVYNLAVRFLWKREDAQDATQEILIRVITNLAKFEGHSTLKTWVYRLATNYLLNVKRHEVEQISFEEGAGHLSTGLSYLDYQGADQELLEEEMKLSCTTSLLICLSRPLRLAYLIGEILEFDGNEGGYILDISPATFRKRLSNARKLIRSFMSSHCGLYHEQNPCRCSKQISYSLEAQWFSKDQLNFMSKDHIQQQAQKVDHFIDEVAIFHSHPTYRMPVDVLEKTKELLSNKGDFLT
ncbi:MAG: sigma factor [Bacteroidota bacterium]